MAEKYFMNVNKKGKSDLILAGEYKNPGLGEKYFDEDYEKIKIVEETKKENIMEAVDFLYGKALESGHAMGPFGDVVEINVKNAFGKAIILIDIYEQAFPKPGTAADVCIALKPGNKFYMASGIRGFEPGKGKNAFNGGFRDCKKRQNKSGKQCNPSEDEELEWYYESGKHCALREGKEEISLDADDFEKYLEDYSEEPVPVTVNKFGKKIETILYCLGTIPTTNEEKLKRGKRVYTTTAFLLPLEIDEGIEKDKIKNELKAGDDNKETVITEITEDVKNNSSEQMPELAFGHHKEIYRRMIKKLNEIYFGG